MKMTHISIFRDHPALREILSENPLLFLLGNRNP